MTRPPHRPRPRPRSRGDRPRHLTAVAASYRLTEADLTDLINPARFERYLPPEASWHNLPVVVICTTCREAVASADDTPPVITRRQEGHRCTGQLRLNPYHDPRFDEGAAIITRPPGPCPAHTAWPASPWHCRVTGCPGSEQREDNHAGA
jgi:hypothetical protein